MIGTGASANVGLFDDFRDGAVVACERRPRLYLRRKCDGSRRSGVLAMLDPCRCHIVIRERFKLLRQSVVSDGTKGTGHKRTDS
jgi:hypothetical protein